MSENQSVDSTDTFSPECFTSDMVSTIQNTDLKQKDSDHAVVVAVAAHAVFEVGPQDGDDLYRVGVASTLLQAMQSVNNRLLEKDPAESLLFDVVLMTTDSRQQQQRPRIISSTRHHSLNIDRFCFSNEGDFVESLLKNNVQLFLTADRNEVVEASRKGLVAALLDQQTASCQLEQLRVMFCGSDFTQPVSGDRQHTKKFLTQLGQMKQKLGLFDSPLSTILVTSRGGRDSCSAALKTLRAHGLSVDEAHCLAGAPRQPILSLLRPHFLLGDALCIPGAGSDG